MDAERVTMKKGQVLVALSVSLLVSLTAGYHHCHHGHYWATGHHKCLPCTKCPRNEIIRRPCHKRSDTVCGPFREFSWKLGKSKDSSSSYASVAFQNALFRQNNGTRQGDGDFDDGGDRDVVSGGGGQQEAVLEKDDGQYWKNLAFALIGVTCVLIFLATVVVLVACKKLHENAAAKWPDEEDDDDSGYVVIRSIRPPPSHHVVRGLITAQQYSESPSAARALLESDNDNSSGKSNISPKTDTSGSSLSQRQGVCASSTGVYLPRRHLMDCDAGDDDVFETENNSGLAVVSGAESESCSLPSDVVNCGHNHHHGANV